MDHQRKTICIITFSQGGPFVWGANLAKHLKNKGYEVDLFHGRYREYLKMKFKRFDIIHCVRPIPYPFFRKFILTIHGNYKEETSLFAKLLYPILTLIARKTTVPSLFLKNAIGIKGALVIPNGIDLPSKTKPSYALNGKKPTVGLLTNFNFRPKADGTIKLAGIISKISPEIKLMIGGSGEFFEEYKKNILKIHPNTEFAGHCQKEDFFNKIDIFSYYSLLDNQPLALLEAMAYGLPVISNPVGAVPEMLAGELSEYVAKDDADYKIKLEKLIASEEDRMTNGQAGIRISQDFSWDKVVERFIELYENNWS